MQAGTLLAQRYRIDGKIGEGGMGVVFKAHDALLNRTVAVKSLTPALLGPEGLARLLREAQAAAQLTHPNIIAVYDVIDDGDARLIVMEYVEGRTLTQLIPQQVPQALALLTQICRAMQYAHSKGIIHRDIKPENIMLTDGDVVKVMDFGLARSEGRTRLTQAGYLLGTVAYMAPEQVLGGETDARSDLYSLGCVLYELTTGRLPFTGDDPISIISQHLQVPPVAPHWHNPNVSPELEGIILKLMAKDPGERYASAADVIAALDSLTTAIEQPGEAGAVPAPTGLLLGSVLRTRLVGRDAELREIKSSVELAASGHGQVALVEGEPGIGKTRLVQEAQVYARLRGFGVLVGHCYEQESAAPYLPFIELFQSRFREMDPTALRQELGANAPEFVKLIPEVRESLPELEPSPPLEPVQERLRLFASVARQLVTLSRKSPLVLILEDLHWADAASLSLLQHLARALKGERVLIIGTYRDVEVDRKHPLGGVLREMNRERLYNLVNLRRLPREGVAGMIKSMFEVPQVSDELLEALYTETEGNPFFVEEVLKALVEEGAIFRKNGDWERKNIAEIQVPKSIREVIERRLERVSEESQQVLSLAAVIGKHFGFEILQTVAEMSEEVLDRALEEAIQAQLVREDRGAGGIEYDFAHALIREVLYERLTMRRRMTLHQKVGTMLEQQFAGRIDAVVEDLAHHFAQSPHGANLEKAIRYSLEAAQKSMRLFAYEEAVRHCQLAAELLRDTPDQARLAQTYVAMGEPLVYLARKEEAVASYTRALAFYDKSGDAIEAARVHRLLGRGLQRLRDFAGAIPHLEAALQHLNPAEHAVEVIQAHLSLARARSFIGQHEASKHHAGTALELATAEGLITLQAEAHASLGLEAHHEGDLDVAQTHYKDALRLAKNASDPDAYFTLNRTLQNFANLMNQRGDHEEALRLRLEQHALARRARDHSLIPTSAFMLALTYYFGRADPKNARRYLQEALELTTIADDRRPYETQLRVMEGDLEAAVLLARESLERVRKTGEVQVIFTANAELAQYLLDLERLEEARVHAAEAAEVAASEVFYLSHPLIRSVLRVLVKAGDHARVVALCEKAERMARSAGNRGMLVSALYGRALLALERGAAEAAVAHCDEALQYTLWQFDRAQILQALAAALLRRGRNEDIERARAAYAEVLGIFEKMEAPRRAEPVKQELAKLES
jgi:predicted ATPase